MMCVYFTMYITKTMSYKDQIRPCDKTGWGKFMVTTPFASTSQIIGLVQNVVNPSQRLRSYNRLHQISENTISFPLSQNFQTFNYVCSLTSIAFQQFHCLFQSIDDDVRLLQ